MENSKQENKTLPWVFILQLLLLTAITTWLVLYEDWSSTEAYLITAGIGLAFTAIGVALVIFITPKADRKAMVKIIIDTAGEDLRLLWRTLWR